MEAIFIPCYLFFIVFPWTQAGQSLDDLLPPPRTRPGTDGAREHGKQHRERQAPSSGGSPQRAASQGSRGRSTGSPRKPRLAMLSDATKPKPKAARNVFVASLFPSLCCWAMSQHVAWRGGLEGLCSSLVYPVTGSHQ
ncbi:hypothetical protein B0H67DRAFT_570599 [Lasiosphaeris hirsuta]|uniref:Uncharacterized protein n=1 Tax=Lasiosphaeris hirsuta TaxID=260670 RepID=A0AA40E567_9PEZI|nr:hypothetical protein B0H67DRAFT_570599 [Lasiosphaeris hirsuta]